MNSLPITPGLWSSFIYWLRHVFHDQLTIITCVVGNDEGFLPAATFSDDNISVLPSWLGDVESLVATGDIDRLAIVVRVFIPETISVTPPPDSFDEQRPIEVPRKEIIHFLLTTDLLSGFDAEEVYDSQNTDFITSEEITHEEGVTYRDSTELVERFLEDITQQEVWSALQALEDEYFLAGLAEENSGAGYEITYQPLPELYNRQSYVPPPITLGWVDEFDTLLKRYNEDLLTEEEDIYLRQFVQAIEQTYEDARDYLDEGIGAMMESPPYLDSDEEEEDDEDGEDSELDALFDSYYNLLFPPILDWIATKVSDDHTMALTVLGIYTFLKGDEELVDDDLMADLLAEGLTDLYSEEDDFWEDENLDAETDEADEMDILEEVFQTMAKYYDSCFSSPLPIKVPSYGNNIADDHD